MCLHPFNICFIFLMYWQKDYNKIIAPCHQGSIFSFLYTVMTATSTTQIWHEPKPPQSNFILVSFHFLSIPASKGLWLECLTYYMHTHSAHTSWHADIILTHMHTLNSIQQLQNNPGSSQSWLFPMQCKADVALMLLCLWFLQGILKHSSSMCSSKQC